jgi:hypothetical protein
MADVSKALNVVRKLNPMGFFSRATEEAQRLPQAKGTGEQMRAMLLKQGVKPDELKWTGFDEWAKGKKSVTRDEITEFLRRNEVQLGEKRLSGKEEYGKWEPEAEGVIGDVRQVNVNPNPTKFEQYTLPGGKDYNELLLTRPRVEKTIPELEAEMGFTRPLTNEQQDAVIARWKQYKPGSADYQSSHWDDPNVLAHMRMSGRTDPEGRRVLHLEELQSDWAQEGRKKGFDTPERTQKVAALKEEERRLQNYYNDLQQQKSRLQPTGGFVGEPIEYPEGYNETIARLTQEMRNTQSEISAIRQNMPGTATPNAPFVESTPGWTNLALKRAMIEAARGNYDAIAWTPGAEQAKRFDLSKQIDDIRYAPSADGRTVSLEAYRGGENIFNQTNMPIAKLDEFVGRDVAERIAKGVGETDPNTGYRVLSGLDLQVGGEGMKGYYDKILPTQIGKVLKDINETPQFGTVNVPTPTRDARYHRLDDAELMAELRQNGDPPQSMTLPSINLTPQMREKINQGLPLFTMMPAAVGLGATASQMQEGQNPAVEGEGFADGGKIVRKALEAVRGLPKAVGLEEFMPAAGERRLPRAVGLEDFMRGAGERRLPKAVGLEEFMPPAGERRLPDAVGLEEFMPAAREPRLPEAVGLEEFMPIDRAGGGKVVAEALQAIQRNQENGGPVDMRAGEMIGLRARLGLSPKKITDRAGPIHTDPAVAAARDAAAAEENPAVVEQALDVVRSQPRQPVAARPLTIPAPRSAPTEPSESQRLWQLYNESESPADFVRADEAMRAGRADGGRLLEDQYPTQYLPDVGRQVMQDGGAPEDFVSAQGRRRSTLEGLGGFEDRPVMDPATMGQNWANAVARMKVEDYAKRPEGRSAPPRPPEQFVRPLDLDWRDKIGGAIAGDGGAVRGRIAKALVGNTGMPDTGMGFGLLDLTPFGAPLAVSDVSTALKNEDYLGAALAPAGYAAYLARKPIGAAARWTYDNAIRPTYDAGRRAVDVAGDVLGRVPAPIAAAGAGAAAMTPEEAEAAGKSKMVRQVLDIMRANAPPPSNKDPRFWHNISSTKLSRPLDEMRASYERIDPVFQTPVRNPADYEGKALVTTFGDPSIGGVRLTGVNDQKLENPTLMQGGPSFVHGEAARGPDRSIWASDLNMVSALANRAAAAQKAGYEPFLNYVKMGGESPDYSHHITDPLLDLFRQSRVPKGVVSEFDRKMREGFNKDFPNYADWPGLRSKDLDNYLFETGPAKARTAMAKLMGTGEFQNLGMPDVGAVRFAATEPDLLNVPNYSSGRMIARMDPEAKAIRKTAVPHKTYRTQLPAHPEGADPARFSDDVPLGISHYDWVQSKLAEKPNMNPSQLQYTYTRSAPTLYMTPQTVDRVSTFLDLKQRGLIP